MSRKNWKEKALLEQKAILSLTDVSTQDLIDAEKFLSKLLEYKKLDKLKTTFIDGPKKAVNNNNTVSVHCDFNLDGTVTGRASCTTYYGNYHQPKGVSFHTLSKKDKKSGINIRNIYGIEDISLRSGVRKVFITADYSTMELRVLAYLANIKVMKEAFQNGKDLHAVTAANIFKKALADVTEEERNIAKTANFLIVYGGGAANLSEIARISLHEAQSVINKIHELYPEISLFFKKVENEIVNTKQVVSIFGRVRHLPDIDSDDPTVRARVLRQGFNMLVQSAASDFLLCANKSLLYYVGHSPRKTFPEFRIVANVHDSMEIIADAADLGKLEVLLAYLCKSMEENPCAQQFVAIDVPLVTEIEIGTSFGNGKPLDLDNLTESVTEAIEHVDKLLTDHTDLLKIYENRKELIKLMNEFYAER